MPRSSRFKYYIIPYHLLLLWYQADVNLISFTFLGGQNSIFFVSDITFCVTMAKT